MTPLLERALALFVAPAPPSDPPGGWEPPVPARSPEVGDTSGRSSTVGQPASTSSPVHSVVLGSSTGAVLLAAALANELRARARAGTALLLVWDPSGTPAEAGPAWPAARRLAERLEAAKAAAVARGHLVRVDLAPDVTAAAAQVSRLNAGDCPAVLVVAGPRPAAFDPLLAAAGQVVLAVDPARPAALAGVAADELARFASGVAFLPPSTSSVGRLLAGAGIGRLRRMPTAGEGGT